MMKFDVAFEIALIIIGIVVVPMILMQINIGEIEYEYETEMIAIKALDSGSEVDGEFFVVYGQVDEIYYYRVMMTDGEKSKFYKLRAERTDVYELEDYEKPYMSVKWEIRKKSGGIMDLFTLDIYNTAFEGYSDVEGKVVDVDLYVPKGTINEDFNISLE